MNPMQQAAMKASTKRAELYELIKAAGWTGWHPDDYDPTDEDLERLVEVARASRPGPNPMQQAVEEFHRKLGQPVGEKPGLGTRPELRAKLIMEEAEETAHALLAGDLTEAVDGLCDLLYVTFGTAVEMGIDLQPFFDEVHRTNLAKVGGPVRGDGKVLKSKDWQPPRIAEMLAALRAGACHVGCGETWCKVRRVDPSRDAGPTAGCHLCGWKAGPFVDDGAAWEAAQGHKCP